MSRRVVVSAAAVLMSVLASPAITQIQINHPGDGYPTLQAAVNAAGPGGSVRIAEGVYNERVQADAGVKLIGAGVDKTIILGTGLADPFGTPLVVLGAGHPFAPFPITGPHQVSRLTLRAGTNGPTRGVGTVWSQDVDISDLRVEGFRIGISINQATNVTVRNCQVSGRGAAGFRLGITASETGLFLPLLPGGHMTGITVLDCSVEDTEFGYHMTNVSGARVLGNVARHTTVLGIQLFGAIDCEVARNQIRDGGSFAGLNLENCIAANVHHNRFCGHPVAIRYEPSVLPDMWGFGPSQGNAIHHNTFWNNVTNVLEEDPYATNNRSYANVEDPSGCDG